ncbi:MAG: hypothetical protein MRY83_24975 [Flavobacteriales bacterium]|nr:hypothetical protein [Flavobacteriales bacterium]
MNINSNNLKSLVRKCNKEKASEIVKWIDDDQGKFDDLMCLVYGNDLDHSMRASWIVDMVCAKNDKLFESHLDQVIENLGGFKHEGVHRSLLKIISNLEIPEKHLAHLFDKCLNWLIREEVPIAVKVHGMQVAFNISQKVPELQRELALVLEENYDNASVGFKSRARKLIKKLSA